MRINRVWAMPNANAFSIKPIAELIGRYYHKNSIDPFANSNKIASITNDLNPAFGTDFNLDATDFLKQIESDSIDLCLYDPPYSPRQVSEVYKQFGKTVNMQTTQASYWSDQKKEISRLMRASGIVISFCWNSGGIGAKYGFEIIEILLVPHGGWHNDTIVTVERKIELPLKF